MHAASDSRSQPGVGRCRLFNILAGADSSLCAFGHLRARYLLYFSRCPVLTEGHVQRRQFMRLLGAAAAAWPLAARGQPRAKVPRLGVLLFSNPETDPNTQAVRNGLRELGYVEGRDLVIVYRYAEGKLERVPDLALDLVREKPDVLFALGGDVAPSAVKASSTIPIVFVSSADPVQLGLVASLSRPGGNATGV